MNSLALKLKWKNETPAAAISAGVMSHNRADEKTLQAIHGSRGPMQNNTLTTIDKLRPGDKFCKVSGTMEFIKINHPPVHKRHHTYRCHAVQIGSVIPVAFKETTEVIYFK